MASVPVPAASSASLRPIPGAATSTAAASLVVRIGAPTIAAPILFRRQRPGVKLSNKAPPRASHPTSVCPNFRP